MDFVIEGRSRKKEENVFFQVVVISCIFYSYFESVFLLICISYRGFERLIKKKIGWLGNVIVSGQSYLSKLEREIKIM